MQNRSNINPFILSWWDAIEELSKNQPDSTMCNCKNSQCIRILEQIWSKYHNVDDCVIAWYNYQGTPLNSDHYPPWIKKGFYVALGKLSKLGKVLYG